jgi:hypothetical protein
MIESAGARKPAAPGSTTRSHLMAASARDVRRFWAKGSSRRYVILVSETLTEVRTHSAAHAAPMRASSRFRTVAGDQVIPLSDGKYQIVQTGEVLTQE